MKFEFYRQNYREYINRRCYGLDSSNTRGHDGNVGVPKLTVSRFKNAV